MSDKRLDSNLHYGNAKSVAEAQESAYRRLHVLHGVDSSGTSRPELIRRLTSDEVRPKWLADELSQHLNLPVLPLFDRGPSLDSIYRQGERLAVIAILDNVDLVSEWRLSWEQVHEFRADSDSRRKYRRLVHWLDGQMTGKPLTFICDEVATRLDDYSFALRKHGIRTVSGALKSLLDWKLLASGALTTAGVSTILNQPDLAVLAGASVGVGKVALEIVERKIELEDIKRTKGAEIAFVHDVKRLLA